MADVLQQQGKPQEALALYEQAGQWARAALLAEAYQRLIRKDDSKLR